MTFLKHRIAKPPGAARVTKFWNCSRLKGYVYVAMHLIKKSVMLVLMLSDAEYMVC